MSVLGQIGRFWPKILISTGVSKSFGTQITEETPRQLVPIVFWSGMRPNGPKIPIFGQKCQFWAKFGRFLAKKTIFWGDGVKLLVPSYQGTNEAPFLYWKHWPVRLKLATMDENLRFWPKSLDIWGQKSIFCLVIAIFVDGTNDHYTRGYNFPIGTTPKKFSVSELGVIFWGSPLFLAVFGHWRVRRATTLSFGPISTKLGGIIRAIKKMTQKDNGPGPGRNYGETGVFTFGQKVVFGLKMGLTPKNHPLIIWAKETFFFEQLFPVVARTWLELKSVCLFLGQKFRFLVRARARAW